jgi:hypothetical protein
MIWNGHSFASHLLLRINLRQSQNACEMHSVQQEVFIYSSFEKVCFMDMSLIKFYKKYPMSKAVCTAEQGKISTDWFGAGQKLNTKNLCFSWMQHGLH